MLLLLSVKEVCEKVLVRTTTPTDSTQYQDLYQFQQRRAQSDIIINQFYLLAQKVT